MVAPLTEEVTEKRGSAAEPPREHSPRRAIPELLRSLRRVGRLRAQIWATRAKMKVAHALLLAGLLGAAGMVGLLAVIFLYIGVFRLLTDIAHVQPAWVYLMYFGVHALGVVAILVVAKNRHKGMG